MFHSTLPAPASQVLARHCSRGYALFVDGELVMKEDSRIAYISGSTSQCLQKEHRKSHPFPVHLLTLRRQRLSCVEVDGARITSRLLRFPWQRQLGVVVRVGAANRSRSAIAYSTRASVASSSAASLPASGWWIAYSIPRN